MKSLFVGCGVALVTPFINGKVDYSSLEKLINHTISGGASAIVILGTTGEAVTITRAERTKIIKFAKKIIAGRIKLIVGTGSNDFSLAMDFTKEAKALGADGALIVTPYYNKTTQSGIINYYAELSKFNLPIIAYNVPARTGLTINLETISKIIETNPMVYGIKESSTDISRIITLHEICREKIAVYSGEDNLNYLFYCLGASGTISVTANAYPAEVAKLYNFCLSSNIIEARSQASLLNPIDNALFLETNPSPIKHLLKDLKIIASDEVRMPLIGVTNETAEALGRAATCLENR